MCLYLVNKWDTSWGYIYSWVQPSWYDIWVCLKLGVYHIKLPRLRGNMTINHWIWGLAYSFKQTHIGMIGWVKLWRQTSWTKAKDCWPATGSFWTHLNCPQMRHWGSGSKQLATTFLAPCADLDPEELHESAATTVWGPHMIKSAIKKQQNPHNNSWCPTPD